MVPVCGSRELAKGWGSLEPLMLMAHALYLQEGVHLPRVAIAGELRLEGAARRDDLHLGEIVREARHAECGRVLNPALGGVGDDERLAHLERVHDEALDHALERGELLAHLRAGARAWRGI